jgi:hypothetical protein
MPKQMGAVYICAWSESNVKIHLDIFIIVPRK